MSCNSRLPFSVHLFEYSSNNMRVCRVMQQNQEYIPNVLAVFLGNAGMGHPDEVGDV